MARMTAQDFVTNIRANCGGETTETLTDNRILRAVNQELLRICTKYRFPQLETSETVTTVSGTAEYELTSSDEIVIDSVKDSTSGIRLKAINREKYEDQTGSTTVSGIPTNWFISGVGTNSRWQITLYPTPAGAYSVIVYYRKVHAELVLSPSPTSFYLPEPWDSIIEDRATARCWAMLHDASMSKFYMSLGKESEKDAGKLSEYVSEEPIRQRSIAGIH